MMKTVTIQVPDWNHTLPRVVALCLAIAGLGVATWYGTRPPPMDDGGSFVETTQNTPPNDYNYQTQPAAYRERTDASEGSCNQWDLSPAAMEAVLQEMIRRGWKPPMQGEAIASLNPATGAANATKVISLDPNAPMPVTVRGPPAPVEPTEEGAPTDETAPVAASPTTRPPIVNRAPSATPPVVTAPRTTPPVVATPRPAQPPVDARPAPAPPAAAPPAAPAAPATTTAPPASAPATAAPLEPASPN